MYLDERWMERRSWLPLTCAPAIRVGKIAGTVGYATATKRRRALAGGSPGDAGRSFPSANSIAGGRLLAIRVLGTREATSGTKRETSNAEYSVRLVIGLWWRKQLLRRWTRQHLGAMRAAE